MSKNKFSEFVEDQALLDGLSFTLKTIYKNNEIFSEEGAIEKLATETLNVYKYMRSVHDELLNDPEVKQTSKTNNVPLNKVASDIIDIIIYSTIARQSLLIDCLTSQE